VLILASLESKLLSLEMPWQSEYLFLAEVEIGHGQVRESLRIGRTRLNAS